ncbi:carboxypeptidase regulatory-like domain-containing protein [Archangium violaceum]|uniref:carboxypeptidase-like regulatory domain-containing protein n=1 Tax=Archangium violaceum TaxID=83451 RepID=UPI001950977E|nr:carboxypeptidase-like regulatory domain-containing protein [Archangium violaceum]QRN98997.1 carboxypeptidase regulatory-like domain-containing protein [Archangium violaceum]
MIDEVDQRMKDWVGRVLGDAPISLAVPDRDSVDRGVGLYLLELGPAPPPRTSRRPPLRVSLCYLVTTGGESPERAHHLLGELVFAALEEPDFEVDLSPVPVPLWTALGVAPRPAFRLRVPLERERPMPAVPLIRVPLITRAVPATVLPGRVVGPGDIPIADALVALPSMGLSVRTDAKGRFRFASVPSDTPLGRLEVRAKGAVLAVRTEELPTEEGALLVRLPLKEG